MKALFCVAALATVLCATSVPAKAEFVNYDREVVRSAQIRLSQLGLPVGSFSGLTDQATTNALMDFQRINGLPITGLLTDATYNLLFQSPAYHAQYQNYVMPTVGAVPVAYYQPMYYKNYYASPIAATNYIGWPGYYAMPTVSVRYR